MFVLPGMRAIAVLLGVLVLYGCADQGLPLPCGAERFTPPDIYRRWWGEVEECSGRTAGFDSITWYFVGDDTTQTFRSTTAEHPSEPQEVCGLAIPESGIVVVAKGMLGNEYVLRHEILHILANTPRHPPEIFGPGAPCYCLIAHGGK